MTRLRVGWRGVVVKGYLTVLIGAVGFPAMAALPFLTLSVPWIGDAGEAIRYGWGLLLIIVRRAAPYGLLFIGIVVWRCFRWAEVRVGEQRVLDRSVIFSAVLGILWMAFALLTLRAYAPESLLKAPDRIEWMLLLGGLIAGAVSGWLLFQLLRRELAAVSTATR